MSTLTELQDLLREKYDVDAAQVPPDVNMQEGGLDSLAIAEFMFAVEDHFHITLPDDDPNINTLAQLADLIDRVKATPASGPVAHANGTVPAVEPATSDGPSSMEPSIESSPGESSSIGPSSAASSPLSASPDIDDASTTLRPTPAASASPVTGHK